MKEILLAILIAGSLLTGCSSEPSGNEATQEPATEEYVLDDSTKELCAKVEKVLASNEYINEYDNKYGITYEVVEPRSEYEMIHIIVAVPGNLTSMIEDEVGQEEKFDTFYKVFDNIEAAMFDAYEVCDESYDVRSDIVSDVVVDLMAEADSTEPDDYVALRVDNGSQVFENEYGLYVYDCRDYYRDPENLKKVIENQKAF